MLCVFDVNETLLDLAALDGFFGDVAGAAAAGMRTVLIARHGESPLPGHPEPTWTVPSLRATADALKG